MDPQQRLFLQEAYKALEDAGCSGKVVSARKVGVYVGVRNSDYLMGTVQAGEDVTSHQFLGNDSSILASRLSYHLNLKGPSLAVDTACSSSLVAVHLACESLENGQCEMVLAGGVFVMSTPQFYILASKTNMLSSDGKCKTFGQGANGIVPGEGVGILVLKSLRASISDRDHIYGVIKGSAINQDGKTKGITAPSTLSQVEVINEAYQNAGVTPETIGYVEAHGTGTKLGDPIEIAALTKAFGHQAEKSDTCALGSLKPNIGHTITVAGVAGILKNPYDAKT